MKPRIVALVEDIFFAAKIRGTAEAVGIEVSITRSVEAALEIVRADTPRLIIADLHAGGESPFLLAERLKADPQLKAIPLMGFFSHVQIALKQRAEEAGYDRIVPRSYFSQHLARILKGGFTTED